MSRYIPSLHRLGGPAGDPEQIWTRLEDPETLAAYRAATRGLTPYPASQIGALRAPQPPASVPIEIYEPAKAAGAGGSSAGASGSGGTDALPWLLAGAGVVLLGGLGLARRRHAGLRH